MLRIGYLKQRSTLSFSCYNFTKLETPSWAFSSSLPDSRNTQRDIYWWNSTITSAFRSGDVQGACRCSEEMPYWNMVTWNCMISGYVQNHRIAEAQRVFDAMPRRNVVSWTALMTGYARCGMLDEAQGLFDRMPERNVVCWNSMITGYVNSGRIKKAREMFDVMPMRNSASWAIMISGYLKHKLIAEAQFLFDKAPLLDTFLCNSVLSGYVELGHLKDATELFAKMHGRDVVSWNTMITCYSRAGQMELANCLFEKIPDKDIISWTAIIRGYLQNGNVETASKLFHDMPDRDIIAWNTMIGGYVQGGMLEDALGLFKLMPKPDIVSWDSILQGYVQQGDMNNAWSWFEKMPQRSQISWNTLIAGYRDEEALVLFCKMVQEGFKPDQGTFTVVLSVCASLAALNWGRMIHLYVIRAGYEHDTLVMSSLVTMYSKGGLIIDATQVFECMSKRDTVAWNAIIAAHAYHGMPIKALNLFNALIQDGLKPDDVTFLGILSACAHGGFVDEGWHYFESMQKDWKLVPRSEHYSCVVDLLGRTGSIHDACRFIEKIPLDFQTNAWETLLSACLIHGNLELGELVAKRFICPQPSDGGVYVLLSKIYAARGMWQDAANIRALMEYNRAKKELACSWIEIKGNIFSFVCSDKSHHQMEEIYRELDNLSIIMKGIK